MSGTRAILADAAVMKRLAKNASVAGAVIAVLGLLALLPRTNAAFSASTPNQANSFAAATFPPMTFYLHNNPTPPTANTSSQDLLPLDSTAPTATTLRNYDTDRDAFAGLVLAQSIGLNETEPPKYQRWRHVPASNLTLNGTATLTVWSAMKDFATGKAGSVQAGLYDCTTTGTGCTLITSATTNINPWPSTWQPITIAFGTINHTVPTGRALVIKLVVGSSSGDSLWFAYDTTTHTSQLQVVL